MLRRHKTRKRNRKQFARRSKSPHLEQLEERHLLAANHVFAAFSGAMDGPGTEKVIPISIGAPDFSLRGNAALVGFEVSAASGSSFNPAAVTVTDQAGALIPRHIADNLRGSQNSVAIFELKPGIFSLQVRGEHRSTGAFDVSIFLVGDFDGSGDVTPADYTAIRARHGARAGTTNYDLAADADLDGRVSSADLAWAWQNTGDRTAINVVTLSATIASNAVQLPDGSFGTREASVRVTGQSLPGAMIRLDSDGDGVFDDGQVVADSVGTYSLDVSLAEGVRQLRLQTSDTFGQRREAVLHILKDSVAPTLSVDLAETTDSGAKGDLATLFETATFTGSTEPGAQVRITERGASTVADAMGFFSFIGVPLPTENNALTVTASDLVGNMSSSALEVRRDPLPATSRVLAETSAFLQTTTVDVTLAQPKGSRIIEFDIDTLFDRSDATTASGDRLLVYLVNPANPAQTLLGHGAPGTAVFSLTEEGAEFTPGLVRFDGSTVRIDVSSLIPQQTGRLVFQLLSGDADTGSTFIIHAPDFLEDENGTAGPVMPATAAPLSVGSAVDLAVFNQATGVDSLLRNVRYDATAGLYTAELSIKNNGSDIGRRAVVAFQPLPTGATLLNSSGMTAGGAPYLNVTAALPPGGLETGEESASVLVQFSYLGAAPLALRPIVLSAGENRAPQLPPLGPFTVMPGDKLDIPLSATDPDGDPLTYLIRSDRELPSGVLNTSGVLSFTPVPDDLGAYEFVVIADDGALRSEQRVFLTVISDPITTTRISGFIRDAGPNQPPLANVPIEVTLGDGTILAAGIETDENGYFVIAFMPPSDPAILHDVTIKVRAEEFHKQPDDPVYPFIAEKLHLLFERDVIPGVNNVIARPIYLPALNSGTPVISVPNPSAPLQVIERTFVAGEAPAAVKIVKGSLTDQSGVPFTGDLSITEVPPELTPAALPPNLIPDIVVTIQPGEMQFNTPALLTLPNRAGYLTGMTMDLWSINPVTGVFDDVGDGRVVDTDGDGDGDIIETINGGIQNSSWHFFALSAAPAKPTTECVMCPCDPAEADATSSVLLHSGVIREDHATVSYSSLGVPRSVVLHYDSLRADPRPIVGFETSLVSIGGLTGPTPGEQRLAATLDITQNGTTVRVPGEPGTGQHYWRIPGEGNLVGGIQVDMRDQLTGVYDFELRTGTIFLRARQSGSFGSAKGKIVSVNGRGGPFGNGWGIVGLQQLVETAIGSIIIVDGNGHSDLFERIGSVGGVVLYRSPTGDFTRFEQLADGTFRRTTPEQTVFTFDAAGKLVEVRDRNGNQTTYVYSGTLLSQIFDPVGLATNFAYENGRLKTITDPAGRITTLTHDAQGNLRSVTDPDGSIRSWNYDHDFHMVEEITKRGFRESLVYSSLGRAKSGHLPDGGTRSFTPALVQGLDEHGATRNPDTAPFAGRSLDAFYSDENGNVTQARLDALGQLVRGHDLIGSVGEFERDDKTNLPVSTRNKRGDDTEFTFDDRGNLTSVSDQVASGESRSLFTSRTLGLPTGVVGVQQFVLDLNDDGFLDVAVLGTRTGSGSSLYSFIAQGPEVFVPPIEFVLSTTGFGAPTIAFGDLNSDRLPDLVNAPSSRPEALIFSGNGTGRFDATAKTVPIPTGNLGNFFSTSNLSVEDLNSDGHLDFRIFRQGVNGTQITEMLDDGAGQFSVSFQGAVPDGRIVLRDYINEDSLLDYITLIPGRRGFDTDRLGVFLGNAVGAPQNIGFLQLPQVFDTYLSSFANVDGGDNRDLIVSGGGRVHIFPGTGEGRFGTRVDYLTPLNGGGSGSLSAIDVNEDGAIDIVRTGNDADVLLNDGAGGFTGQIGIATALGAVGGHILHDFDGDGKLDLELLAADGAFVMRGDGTGRFGPAALTSATETIAITVTADLNGDKLPDLISNGSMAGTLAVGMATAPGQFTPLQKVVTSLFPEGEAIVATDIDSDGHVDVLGASSTRGAVLLFGDGNGGFTERVDLSTGLSFFVSRVTYADLNEDGRDDILIFDGQKLAVFKNQGNRQFMRTILTTLSVDARGILGSDLEVGDVNGDDNLDLVYSIGGYVALFSGTNIVLDFISVAYGDGLGQFPRTETYASGRTPSALAVGDLNSDGRDEVAVFSSFGSTMSNVLSDNGSGAVVSIGMFNTGGSPFATIDMDGDGRLDLVTRETSRFTVRSMANGGTSFVDLGTFVTGGLVSNVGDFDADGDIDVLTRSGSSVFAFSNGTISPAHGPTGTGHRDFTYDAAFSQLTRITDELDHKTLYEIDPANGNRLSMTEVIGAIGGDDDLVTRYEYTAPNRLDGVPPGLMQKMTDPRGRVTEYAYDTKGRLTSITFAKGTPDEATREFVYNESTVAGKAGLVTAMIDEEERRTEYEYDVMNRLIRTIEPDPDRAAGPLTSPETSFEYDKAGNLVKTTDARDNVTENVYDNRERLSRRTDADPDGPNGPLTAPVTKFDYDFAGNRTTIVDPLNHVTMHAYDARNRRIKTTDPDNGVTQFRYDLDDNLTAVIDPVSNRTQFVYDQRNRMTRETDPFGESTVYTYDPADRLIQKTDREGRKIRYVYDDADRLITETWLSDNGDTDNVLNYKYDDAGNLESVFDKQSSLVFTYDDRNRVDTVDNRGSEALQGTPGAPRIVLDYGYDRVGNVRTLVDKRRIDGVETVGATTTYEYDDLDRLMTLTQVGAGLSDKRVDFAYNPLGQYASINRYRDLDAMQLVVGTSYTYDALNRLDVIRHVNSNNQTLNFHNLDYDAASRITRITDIDGIHDYLYDNRDQLIGAKHEDASLPDETYEYDANGNRLNSHLHGGGYETGRGNRLESDGTYNYEYDDEGNTILRTRINGTESDGSTIREFTWDHRNRLVSVTDKLPNGTPTQVVRFTYDALDRRLSKAVDTTPTDAVDAAILHFVNDREDVILDFLDPDGAGPQTAALSQRYLHGPAIDQVLAQDNATGVVHWHLTDHLGTVKDLVDQAGAVDNHITYDSYGNVVAETDAGNASRYGFTGREREKETSFLFLRNRYYAPTIGVFLSEDHFASLRALGQQYRYGLNTPQMIADPSGLSPSSTIGENVGKYLGKNLGEEAIENSYERQFKYIGLDPILAAGLGNAVKATVFYSLWFVPGVGVPVWALRITAAAIGFDYGALKAICGFRDPFDIVGDFLVDRIGDILSELSKPGEPVKYGPNIVPPVQKPAPAPFPKRPLEPPLPDVRPPLGLIGG